MSEREVGKWRGMEKENEISRVTQFRYKAKQKRIEEENKKGRKNEWEREVEKRVKREGKVRE